MMEHRGLQCFRYYQNKFLLLRLVCIFRIAWFLRVRRETTPTVGNIEERRTILSHTAGCKILEIIFIEFRRFDVMSAQTECELKEKKTQKINYAAWRRQRYPSGFASVSKFRQCVHDQIPPALTQCLLSASLKYSVRSSSQIFTKILSVSLIRFHLYDRHKWYRIQWYSISTYRSSSVKNRRYGVIVVVVFVVITAIFFAFGRDHHGTCTTLEPEFFQLVHFSRRC